MLSPAKRFFTRRGSSARRRTSDTRPRRSGKRRRGGDDDPGVSRHHRHRRRKTKSPSENRKWVFSPLDCSRYKDRFVVLSYNILGVENAAKHLELYHGVSSENLDWNQRKKRIRNEIRHYTPSILCLQEVDNYAGLADILQVDGYKGVYKGRTGPASDGCAIFWREDLFTMLYKEDIEFQKFGLRDNVAQLCVLKMNVNCCSNTFPTSNTSFHMAQTNHDRCLLVGNTHLLFNPNRGDIKLGQLQLFLERAHSVSQEWGGIPVAICGDLNSTPLSAIYQYLASSELDLMMHDRREISGMFRRSLKWSPYAQHSVFSYRWSEEEISLASGGRQCTYLKHNLRIQSAYPGVPGNCRTRDDCGEPLATTYHSQYMGTVDYIWHSLDLVPIRVVETLPIDVLRKTGGLPSEKWGSDHLALVCELAFAADDRTSSSAGCSQRHLLHGASQRGIDK